MELLPGLRFPSTGSPAARHTEDRRFIRRLPPDDAFLACPEVVSGDSRSPRLGRSTPPAVAGSDRPHVRPPTPSHSSSSTRLEDFRRLRGLSVSDDAFRLICGSWRPSTATRYDAIWRSFKDFLSSRGILLLSVDLKTVVDYLSSLFDLGLAYRTITLHRSVLSATLPPLDGF